MLVHADRADCSDLVQDPDHQYNSAKYAHYAPGLVNRLVRFDSMAGCVEAARTGRQPPRRRRQGTLRQLRG